LFLRSLTARAVPDTTSFREYAWPMIVMVYTIIAGVALFRLGLGTLRGLRLRRAAIRLNEGWASGWDIRVSARLGVPVTYGRTILLPEEWPTWSDFKRDAILIHEKSHVRRGDFYVQLLAGVHRAVFWFSPLAWWLKDQLLKASENACDDEAIEKVGDRISYAELLLELTKIRSNDRLMGVAMARGKTVERRVERILREKWISPRLSVVRRIFIIAAIVPLVGLAAGSWLVQAETELLPVYTAVPVPAPALALQQGNPTPPAPAPTPAPQGRPAPVSADAGALGNWVEENVVDISTDEEQAAFKALRNDAERQAFIEQFWLRRDPTPGTSENEFRQEFFRRVALANERYGTPATPGWKTDRGRILVLFGEADEVETHALGGTFLRADGVDLTARIPFEKWRYRVINGIGQNIVLEFVDVDRNGVYRLTFDPAEKDKLIRPNR
jgi:GWxTD domain-containing protein